MNLSEKEKQNALNEVRILASIRHPNIVGYKEVFIDDQTMLNRIQLALYLKMQFLNLAQNLTSYGSSFFLEYKKRQKNKTDIFN